MPRTVKNESGVAPQEISVTNLLREEKTATTAAAGDVEAAVLINARCSVPALYSFGSQDGLDFARYRLRLAGQKTGMRMCQKTQKRVGASYAFGWALGAVTSNKSFQPTSHSSLRSSCAAAELSR